ncbi:MAG TPA: transposase [Stellaceae bacterium]|nr:transposase [Stellaceae bacterium]
MDIHTHNAQAGRLEVVETGRRRRWSEDEKLRIVLESLKAPRQASSTARRHGISPSLLFAWRRSMQVERRDASDGTPSFVPAMVVTDKPSAEASTGAAKGRMVIILGNGRRVIVDAGVDPVALARVLEVVERR